MRCSSSPGQVEAEQDHQGLPAGDPVTVDTLIRYLKSRGYHPTDTRRVLDQFVEIDGKGHVTWKRGGG